MLHWNLSKKYELPAACIQLCEHKAEKALQNDEVKILWDFKIQTDKHLAHSIPDITTVEKAQTLYINDVAMAIPGIERVDMQEQEKIE